MSEPINDGGPAFPQNDAVINRINNHSGMTLRDWFAGQALVGVFASTAHPASPGIGRQDYPLAAIDAYVIADAMLAEREREAP